MLGIIILHGHSPTFHSTHLYNTYAHAGHVYTCYAVHTHTRPHPTHTCSQLRYDGYENAAGAVGQIIATYPPVAPSSRLGHLVQLGMKTEGEGTHS